MEIDTGKYRIELKDESDYSTKSVDNKFVYQQQYSNSEEYKPTTQIGIKLYEGVEILSSSIIKSAGGASGIHNTSQIIERNSLTICCSESVFKLSIPDLTLTWITKADDATCFQIFNCNGDYIIHGELNISRISSKGKILWQNTGADIFTSEKGIEVFRIQNEIIQVMDWNNKIYKFDLNGKILN